ncbi:MAG TPA: response regulator transcription factor [Steroidobacteraceae bacterium]|nr:response regulator transcription factor [Steroidobacteraceae bacterium]
MKANHPLRILVVDDHPIVRLGIRQMIGAEPDLEICGEAGSAEQALQLAASLRPDLALIDLSLEEGTALGLIRELRQSIPEVEVLVLSMHDEMLFAERVLRAGGRGYIMKQSAIDGLVDAIRQVASGGVYMSPKMTQHVLEQLRDSTSGPAGLLSTLTDRELEVFDLIGHGKSTTAIAGQLAVSVKTIETYRANIKTKLKLRDARDLLRLATSFTEGL